MLIWVWCTVPATGIGASLTCFATPILFKEYPSAVEAKMTTAINAILRIENTGLNTTFSESHFYNSLEHFVLSDDENHQFDVS